jgi:atypical dual specificity phosphatase
MSGRSLAQTMTTSLPSFSWVIEGSLGAMSWPHDLNACLEALRERGVGVLISLTEYSPRQALLEEFGVEHHHVPVPDFEAPTPAQIRLFVATVDRARAAGQRVVVHCQAGLGRTGTMLAAYRVSQGLTAEDAIAEIRRLRPGSIETPEQEAAVRGFERSLRRHP